MEKLRISKFADFARNSLHISKKWFLRYITVKYIEINNVIIDGNSINEFESFEEKCIYLTNVFPNVFNREEICGDANNADSIDTRELDDYLSEIIPLEYFKEVELIGWMYQYYISEEKSRVFTNLKNNIKIPKEDISYATQLFTPDWIVKYLVENSLGRLWVESHSDSEIKNRMEFYIEGTENIIRSSTEPEKIKIIDPCMGTGNILLYSFELLYYIYEGLGYDSDDICSLIFKNNLYGTDIDEEAVEIGKLCIVLKAASMCSRITIESIRALDDHLTAIKEPDSFIYDEIDSIEADEIVKEAAKKIAGLFENGREFGSTITVDKDMSEKACCLLNVELSEKLKNILMQSKILSGRYDVVVTNPPYMGIRGMNEYYVEYLNKNYAVSKYDLCTVYMEVAMKLLKENGLYSMINQHSWMFLGSFEEMRVKTLKEGFFVNMLHLGAKAFEENVGTIVQNVAFVVEKNENYVGRTRIIDARPGNSSDKCIQVMKSAKGEITDNIYDVDLSCYLQIPRRPFAYWTGRHIIEIFKDSSPLKNVALPRQGMASSDNKRFLRYWFEVPRNNIMFDAGDSEEAEKSGRRWFPYRKGGKYRKWFGNNTFVVDWERDGEAVKAYAAYKYKSYTRTIKNEEFYFKSGLTYTFISEELGVRYSDEGFIFDVAGSSIFVKDKDEEKILLGFLCSKVSSMFLDIMNPTYNIQVGDLKNIPVKSEMFGNQYKDVIIELVDENIRLSKEEWDDYELSWNFTSHPLVRDISCREDCLLRNQFLKWQAVAEKRFEKVKENEEKLNSLFIDIYGLNKELSPEVNEDKITMRKAGCSKDIKSFISYAVGCILGRYESQSYKRSDVSIITVNGQYEDENDLYRRFKDFVAQVFGASTLSENLRFIGMSLGLKKDEDEIERLKRYLDIEFYKDHVDNYSGRPIYWMLTSGENGAFKGLIYIHKYSGNEFSDILNCLIPKTRKVYEQKLTKLISEAKKNSGFTDEQDFKKVQHYNDCIIEIDSFKLRLTEKIAEKIRIDLNDGIEKNLKDFGDVVYY